MIIAILEQILADIIPQDCRWKFVEFVDGRHRLKIETVYGGLIIMNITDNYMRGYNRSTERSETYCFSHPDFQVDIRAFIEGRLQHALENNT